jgi:hypothetical protein
MWCRAKTERDLDPATGRAHQLGLFSRFPVFLRRDACSIIVLSSTFSSETSVLEKFNKNANSFDNLNFKNEKNYFLVNVLISFNFINASIGVMVLYPNLIFPL